MSKFSTNKQLFLLNNIKLYSANGRILNSRIPRLIFSLPVLSIGFLPFKRVLSPDPLGVNEFGFPRLDVAVQVRNQLILIMGHTRAEVSDTDVSLLRPSEVRLKKTVDLVNGDKDIYRSTNSAINL